MEQRRNEGRTTGMGPQVWWAGALACALATPALAQPKPTVEELQRRLEALEQRYGAGQAATSVDGQAIDVVSVDQRLRVLERNLELAEEARQAKVKEAPVVTAGASGAAVKSGDGEYEFKFRGLVQGDGRFFTGGDGGSNDTFLLRRLRPTFEGSLGKLVGYRLTPEFAGDSATIVDAYIDVKFDPAFTIRAGKVKGPVGLERLQSGGAIALVERAFPTELAPNRDIGVQAQGDIVEGKLNYTVGVYNGTPDGRDAVTANPDDEFEFAARLFFEPVKGVGFGVGGSVGDKEGVGNNFLPRYRSQGQQQIFNYRAAVAAAGRHTRLSPQGYLYRGPFGLQAEYIASEQEVALAANQRELRNTAWQATASWVLTGEEASYRGVKPSSPFKPDGGWGAFELVGRYGELEVDGDAFPLFADPAVAVRDASGWTVGVNWYLNSNLKLVVNYLRTDFSGGAAAGADRESEKAIFTRLQASF